MQQLPLSPHFHIEMSEKKPEIFSNRATVERMSKSGHNRRTGSLRTIRTEGSDKSLAQTRGRLLSNLSGHSNELSKKVSTFEEDGISASFGESLEVETVCDETKQLIIESKPSADRVVQSEASLAKKKSPRMGLSRSASRRLLMRVTNEESDDEIGSNDEALASQKTDTEKVPSRRGYFGRSKSTRLMMGLQDTSTENPSKRMLQRKLSKKSSLRDDQENETTNRSKQTEENPADSTRSRRGCFGRSKSMRLLNGVDDSAHDSETKPLGPMRMGLRRQSSRRLVLSETGNYEINGGKELRSASMKQLDSRSSSSELTEKINQSRQRSLRKSQSFDDNGDFPAFVAKGNGGKSQRPNMGLMRSKSFRIDSSCHDQQRPTMGIGSSNGQLRSFRMNLRSNLEQINDIPNPDPEFKLDSHVHHVEKEVTAEPDANSHITKKETRGIKAILLFTNFFWAFILAVLRNPIVKRIFNCVLDLFLFVACKATSLAFWLLACVVDGIRISSQWLINQEVVREAVVAVYTRGESTKQKKKKTN